ncbi:hypothetical protein FMM79_05590 [Novosphingobium sp. BW1]|nr:hypothetical protein FMM79_05590 [Novosphingobium sp. BW1]
MYFLKSTEDGISTWDVSPCSAASGCWPFPCAQSRLPRPYAAWTGTGTLGAFLLGLLIFGERLSPAAISGLDLIVWGAVLRRVATGRGA